jgi:hypothetical protein
MMEQNLTLPKVGDFYFNEGGSLVLIYFSTSGIFAGYNFSSKQQEFFHLEKQCDLLHGGIACNSIRLSTKINFDVEGLIRVAGKIKKE